MPIFDFICKTCGRNWEEFVNPKCIGTCPTCGEFRYSCIDKVPGAPSFKIKGMRAANGYGLKSIDTYGVDQISGKESGYSFTGKGGTRDHNQGDV